jgi:hypothetical protein
MAAIAAGRSTMTESWKPLSRVILKGTGVVACEHGREFPCRLEAAQLYNGRVLVQATVDGESSQVKDWAQGCQRFRISATLDDGRELGATDVYWTNCRLLAPDYADSVLEGFVGRPGCLEVRNPGHRPSVAQSVTYELTNALLDRQVGPLELGEPGTTVTLKPSRDHRWVRRRMEALKTSGVLSSIRLEAGGPRPVEELEDAADALCELLTLVHRSPVAIVGEHWDDPESPGRLHRYREPPFMDAPPLRPLVPSQQLGRFLELTYDSYLKKWQVWDLPNAIDHYVQAHVLRSAWAQAIGFFTAMETLKHAFLARPTRSAHDARGYANVVKRMIKELEIPADEYDVESLIELRNKIIHRGSPGSRKTYWEDETEAFRLVGQFGGLVESMILAILGYHGEFERYDQVLSSGCG